MTNRAKITEARARAFAPADSREAVLWDGIAPGARTTDARFHDLCHRHASHAVVDSESLHVAGRLLDHRRASTTNRYVHLDDATLSETVERVAAPIQRKLSAAGSQ